MLHRFFFCLSFTTLAAFSITTLLDVTVPRGLDFTHQNSPTAAKYLIETMGGGVALLDYNNDGLLDIFLVNSGWLTDETPAPERFARHEPRYWNRLFRQNHDGSFTDVTEEAGLADAGDSNYGMGIAAADYDNDGFTDLYVTAYGHNVLYHNNGNGTFTNVTDRAGVAAGGWSVSAGFFDFDNDGKLDLLVTRYMDWDTGKSKSCGTAIRTYCPPGEFPATTNILYRNVGNGVFEDVSQRSGIAAKNGRSLGVAFADYDDDGLTDVFIANDAMPEFLFHNNGNGTFTERAMDAGVALSDDGKPFSGMGVDFRDYDNDGRPDILVTNLARQVYALYRNEGGGVFMNRSLSSGLATLSGSSSGWGIRFEDFDNDGWKDLIVAQGHVMDNVEQLDASLHYREAPLFALNRLGRLEQSTIEPSPLAPVAGRGLAVGDLNNDGWPDAVISVLGGRPMVLMNHPQSKHWLTLSLIGVKSNRDGFGAVIQAAGQTQIAGSAGSYLSAHEKRVHFGLGDASYTDIAIRWPSGIRQKLTHVAADQFLTVREDIGQSGGSGKEESK